MASVVKRRQLCGSTTSCWGPSDLISVLELPNEILAQVFRMCLFREVAESFRLVCRRFRAVASEVLNLGMATLGPRIDYVIKHVEQLLLKVTTEEEALKLSHVFNALEIIKAQFRLVKAVTWRYVYHRCSNHTPRACFYAGRLLDKFCHLLDLVMSDPVTLGINFHFLRQCGSDTERAILQDMANTFMLHFEKFTERKLNTSPYVSGARIVDLLDCVIDETGKQINWYMSGQKEPSGFYRYKATYILKRSWFTCLNINTVHRMVHNWSGEQRFMYLRVRRMVSNYNDHILSYAHYEREVLVHFQSPLLPPPAALYSGHGQYASKLFYYGNMNETAYETRRARIFPLMMDLDDDLTLYQILTTYSKPPCADLKISVDLYCPLHLAPLKVYETLRLLDLERGSNEEGAEFRLRITFECANSETNRLPSSCTWEISAQSPM